MEYKNKDDITLESIMRGAWICFTIGLFSFTLGIGYLSVSFIIVGVIELCIAGFLGYKAKKELDKRNTSNMGNLNNIYNRETVQVVNDNEIDSI